MLPAASRMRARQDFTLAVRRGRRAGDATLVVHYLGAPEAETRHEPTPARVGFVVPKAIGNAVVRKRVTRRLRHLIRERLPRVPDGALVVVRALPPSAEADYAELETAFDRAWDRVTRPRPVASRTP
jgi:ribonuclease P protein component